jgi:serine/threonine-protein kinase
VYSLGVVLYELLTTKRPFGGNSLDEIAYAVLKGEVPMAHVLNPDVPKVLSEIAAKAMERDVNQRTRSARALSQALRDWLSQQGDAPPSGAASPGAAGKRGGKAAGSSPGLAAVMGWLSGTVALGGVAWVIWQGRTPAEPKPAAPVVAAAPAVVAAPVAPVVPVAASAATPSLASASSAEVAPVASAVTVASVVPLTPAVPVMPISQAPIQAPAPPATQVTSVVAGSTTQTPASSAQPVALPTGTVRLAISPWGEVFEGRRSLGVTPPMTQLTLPAGKHTLTIRNGESTPWRKTVDVKPGGSVNIDHQF